MNQEDIDICRNIATTVFEKVENLLEGQVGNPKAGEFVKIGADGTPTSYIDIIAEDEVIKLLKDADFESYLISEEIGELKLGKGKQEAISLSEELLNNVPKTKKEKEDPNKPRFIFLIDPLDGTSNAIKNIPAYGMSIAVANVPEGREATLNDVQLGFVKNYANGNFYEAIKGNGAKRNGEPMTPSSETDLQDIIRIQISGHRKKDESIRFCSTGTCLCCKWKIRCIS